MPVIWDKNTGIARVKDDFAIDRLAIIDYNQRAYTARIETLRGVTIKQLIIPERVWEVFRETEMWVAIAPCLSNDNGLVIIGKAFNNRGLKFYELTEEMMI